MEKPDTSLGRSIKQLLSLLLLYNVKRQEKILYQFLFTHCIGNVGEGIEQNNDNFPHYYFFIIKLIRVIYLCIKNLL